MITPDKLVRIKWASGNTPFIEIQRTDDRIYPTKRELVSIRDAINMFMTAYPEDFTEGTIDNIDETEDEMELDIQELMKEQAVNKQRWAFLDKLACDAGFNEEALEATEFTIRNLFEAIVEECAQVAERQANTYSGEGNEGAGCYGAANAIRNFGKTLGIPNK